MKNLFLILPAAIALAACSTEGYTPYASTPGAYDPESKETDTFTLQRTACFGICPIYKVTVDARDTLYFEGERFVAETDGVVSKKLPTGSFKRLKKIARDYRFDDFDPRYPNEEGSNCEAVATDMPSVIIGFDIDDEKREVNVYEGCFNFARQGQFNEMVAAMDKVLDVGDWVGAREGYNLSDM